MNSYIAETQTESARFWKFVKSASFGAPFLLAGFFYALFWREISFSGARFTFSLSICAVALILAGTYFFTYKSFEENFYFFIFVSWIGNAVYLIPDLNGPLFCDPSYFTYKKWVFLLSLTSSAFLLVSLFTRGNKEVSKPTWREIPRSTWITIFVVAMIYIGVAYATIPRLPKRSEMVAQLRALPEKDIARITGDSCDIENHVFPQDEHITLAKWMVPGSALSFALLCAVAAALSVRLKTDNLGTKGLILRYTFWLYAGLQFSYPFTPYLITQGESRILPLFLIAQLAKVGNAISMVGVLQSVIAYRDSKRNENIRYAENDMRTKKAELKAEEEKLRTRSQFVELGMLASSIKHDVQTPLATMGFDIEALKQRFQHDPKVTRKLESLEESMDRIEATVQVVDIFRGDKAFFDREEFMRKASMLEIAHRAVRSVKNEKEELKQNNARTRITIDGREVWVRAYVPMLEQVMVNVVKNGLEAIEEGGRQSGLINITVGTTEIPGSEYPRWVKVEIEDNGRGIPSENMEKLTTIFTTRSDRKPNSGIGLFIGKKILDIHDGDIKFESTVDVGTKVTLLLPEWNALRKQEERIAENGPVDK